MSAALARPELAAMPLYNAGLGEAAVRARYGVTQIAKLGSNENPWGPSPAVRAALAGLSAETWLYPDASCAPLREALAARTGVAADRIVCGNGSEHIIEMIAEAFLPPESTVLTLGPCFGLHEIYPLMMGARVRKIPVTGELEYDVPAWRAALGLGARVAMFSNPSNPVGCMLDEVGLSVLIDAAPQDALLVLDEAYYEYARHEPGCPDSLRLLEAQERPWLVLRTFSKAYGLAGLRVGYALASSAALAGQLNKVRTPFPVNVAAQRAALASLEDEAHLAHVVAQTLQCRAALREALETRGLRCAPSAANFLFVSTPHQASALAEALLSRGVIVKPWTEPGYEHWFRVSVGTEAMQQMFLIALDAALEALA
jgi:histidinol-phosphate aminotransferase